MEFKRGRGSITIARFTHYSNDDLPFLTNSVPPNGIIRFSDVFLTILGIYRYMRNNVREDRISLGTITRISIQAHWEIARYIVGAAYLTIGIGIGLWLVSEQHLTLFN